MKISIITATYNCAKTLRGTLDSILMQSYHDYEVIVKDGGSTDGTLEILKEYESKFSEGSFKWVSGPDKGIYDAMNDGIAMASGDVIGILNSDDFFSVDYVLRTVAKCLRDASHIDAVYADVLYVDGNDISRVQRRYSSEIFRPWMMRLGFMPAHPTFYCRREVYEKYGNYDITYKVAGDFELLLRMIYKGGIRIVYVPQLWVTMRTGGASSRGAISHLQINRDHMRAFRENGVKSNYFLLSLRYIYKIGELIQGWWMRKTYGAWLVKDGPKRGENVMIWSD